jgi:hypothetical protein
MRYPSVRKTITAGLSLCLVGTILKPAPAERTLQVAVGTKPPLPGIGQGPVWQPQSSKVRPLPMDRMPVVPAPSDPNQVDRMPVVPAPSDPNQVDRMPVWPGPGPVWPKVIPPLRNPFAAHPPIMLRRKR